LRRRYIGFYIKKSEKINITKRKLINEIKNKSFDLFKQNLNDSGIYIIKFDGNIGIIRCNQMNKDKTIQILKSITKISSNDIEIDTIGTSGTIKGLIKKHMNKVIIFL
jgi:RNase P/RNase MRP subunit POP5